ncbi:hypothetical protein OPV22_019730 [Ensete ventricosum]|uniref:Uncharacterized protein n=2 Tax=Ensete ventricosum TaxID=4639 RepID=A0A445MKK6_ENSVE|nr:hypothetical protein OPV22_019730 [Ensete ventricosum]RWW06785.1 hypothetical protein GW17_00029863 [Ensete ventricosum]RWW42838.1 hypothetical protein BHE74_00051597 [Ensete ventricosum]RZR74812.1 hypothetical protein BHM03_00043885 [Ensete ventricosum]
MGTEVLRPQDCLLHPSPNLRNHKPLRRKRDASPKQPAKPRSLAGGARLAMGRVTILRRGESLDAMKGKKGEPTFTTVAGLDGAVLGAEPLGPDPAMIPREFRLLPAVAAPLLPGDVDSVSGFVLSPSPRALPLPRFSRRKEGSPATAGVVDCSATRDLRRLLRLE